MPTEGLTLEWTGEDSRRHRLRFEPRPVTGAYTRIDEVRTTGGWRVVGQEIVAGFEADVDADCEALEVVA
jgi:hypothetical protein